MGFLDRLFGRQERQPATVLARHNKGTRLGTLAKANAYYISCLAKGERPPSIQCLFDGEAQALRALTSLSFIKEASDTGELVATQPIYFGYYKNERGESMVLLSGRSFSHDLWREAKEKFVAAGGKITADKEPEKDTNKATAGTSTEASLVTFVREERKAGPLGSTNTYRTYRGPSKAAAMAFLQANPVNKPLYYIVVETPEGNFGRDSSGIYEE